MSSFFLFKRNEWPFYFWMDDMNSFDLTWMKIFEWSSICISDFQFDNVWWSVTWRAINHERRWVSSWCRYGRYRINMLNLLYGMRMKFRFCLASVSQNQMNRFLLLFWLPFLVYSKCTSWPPFMKISQLHDFYLKQIGVPRPLFMWICAGGEP